MPDLWRFYRISHCRHTIPVKKKFVIIVCPNNEYIGFLVNSEIGPFLKNRPAMLACQVKLKKSDYGFLVRDSWLDCAQPFDFMDSELITGVSLVTKKTKAEIMAAVAKATTIEPNRKKLILDS